MKFRTEIVVAPWQQPIDYSHTILSLGSCFADNIAERLRERKFRVVASPTGILFNPASIARMVERMYRNDKPIALDELFACDGAWLSYDFHSKFAAETPDKSLQIMQAAIDLGHDALRRADHLILTLGTAWVYRLTATGEVVANCHKQPHDNFRRELLSVEEVVACMERVIACLNPTTQLILTLSPVRHIGEGMEDNSLSKAILRVAIDNIVKRYPRAIYFPSCEALIDDLRDYRFYGDDLVHPSSAAIEYIAEKFFEAALSTEAKRMLPAVEKIVRAAHHRPLNVASQQYKTFCQQQLAAIEELKSIDFDEEKRHFRMMLQINL